CASGRRQVDFDYW
nr:immunoglobulin heavy chain junction region [Macaca mulatta]